MSCTEQFRAVAFAQLTYRESLQDIETCLLANQTKLYGIGFRSPARHSTLVDANYVLDATTRCLSQFPLAPFRSANAAVKLHIFLDLRSNILAFIRISDGKTHEVNILDMLTI